MTDPIEVRVARRFKAGFTEEKLKALLLKLRKGADASISMKQLIEVLNTLGGWKVEPFVGLVKLHGYSKEEDAPTQFVEDNADQVQAYWELVKREEVSTLPSSPQLGKRYTMDVTEPTAKGWIENHTGFKYRAWFGAKGIRFTSPEGAGRGRPVWRRW
jgi:hypothetical protein